MNAVATKCQHPEEQLEITAPCCRTPQGEYGRWDCGCQGQYSVYCYGCDNEDMTDADVERILDRADDEPDYYED